ncbi:MAG TPA: plastocyanin/azurin family copper-binding protein [Ktedonosporobacter sp.]|jgi:plastocyanin|nr:plastocyanin/azurin family copper-binding protein [Ktedonosporobacter sp.]
MSSNRCNVSWLKKLIRLGAIVVSLSVLLAACGSNGGTTTAGGTTPTVAAPTATPTPTPTVAPTPTSAPTGQVVNVSMSRSGAYTLFFAPQTVTISVGTTVVWTNRTSISHTVTSDDGKSFDSGTANPITAGMTFSFKFTKPGTYKYHCALHPEMMVGTIIVT